MGRRPRRPLTLARAWARSNVVTIVLIIFILLSTLLNAIMLGSIYRIREVVRAQLETATDGISAARQQTVHYDFPIDTTFPISTTVHINETLDVPINMTVPIDREITVPVEMPLLGQVELPVDLDFEVPISTTVSFQVDREIPISTNIDLDTEFPLELDLSQPPLGDVLKRLEDALRELLEQM